jgi:hypothetical protein
MTFSVLMLAIAAFLSGAAATVFIMLVVGIHAGDRTCHLADEPKTRLDALTRNVLSVGVRSNHPVSHSDTEEEITNACS